MVSNESLVIALGGNALIRSGQRGSFEEQYANLKLAAKQIVDTIQQGYRVVLTHGNGPQIGACFMRHEISKKFVPDFPLHACSSETQGLMGYMIMHTLEEEFRRRCLAKSVVSVITRVLVSTGDPAFGNPAKPIGQVLEKQQVDILKNHVSSLVMKYQGDGKYRILAPSPIPLEILELRAIRVLLDADFVVIACGGGGIPIIEKEEERVGTDAVIDKDLASEILATHVQASKLVLLTDAEGLYVDYGKPTQRLMRRVLVDQQLGYDLTDLAEGSIKPKVQACTNFIKNGGCEAIIASLDRLTDALSGLSGTHFFGK